MSRLWRAVEVTHRPRERALEDTSASEVARRIDIDNSVARRQAEVWRPIPGIEADVTPLVNGTRRRKRDVGQGTLEDDLVEGERRGLDPARPIRERDALCRSIELDLEASTVDDEPGLRRASLTNPRILEATATVSSAIVGAERRLVLTVDAMRGSGQV